MSAVEEIVGQQLLSPRPRFGRWQAERVFFFLAWPQPDYISAQTFLEYNCFRGITSNIFHSLGLQAEISSSILFLPKHTLEFYGIF